jgi:hypothetical protein
MTIRVNKFPPAEAKANIRQILNNTIPINAFMVWSPNVDKDVLFKYIKRI